MIGLRFAPSRFFTEALLKVLLYMFAFLLPFDGIVGRLGIGFLGGIKVLGALIAFGLMVHVLAFPRHFAHLVKNLFSPISWLALLFVMWNLASVLWALDAEWALSRVVTYLGMFTVMQALGFLGPRDVETLWVLTLVGFAISLPLGFVLPPPTDIIAESGRFTSGGSDPNDYAVKIVVTIAVVLNGVLLLTKGRSILYKSFLSIAIAMSSVAVLLSLSRTGLVTLVLVVLASFYLSLRKSAGIAILALTVILGLGVLGVWVFQDDFTDMLERYATLGNIGQEDTWAGRVDIWLAALKVFSESPWIGVGAANFATVSPEYSPTAAYIASMREDGGGGVAHNMFLSVAAETGVVGLVLFLALLSSVFWSGWVLTRRGCSLAHGLLVGYFVYLVGGLTLTWEYQKIGYFLFGSLLALGNREGAENKTERHKGHP